VPKKICMNIECEVNDQGESIEEYLSITDERMQELCFAVLRDKNTSFLRGDKVFDVMQSFLGFIESEKLSGADIIFLLLAGYKSTLDQMMSVGEAIDEYRKKLS